MAVRTFDRPVLMRHTAVVAGRLHAVMEAQRVIAPGQIGASILVEVAERGRQAVGAMLVRRAAQGPQRVLQSFRQRHIAFAAEDDMGVREAGIGEAEVVEPVIERNACDGHAQFGHVGEVRQSHLAGFVDLAEDHLLVRAMQRPPAADAALQRAARAVGQIGMAPLHLFENRHRAQPRRRGQHRRHLGVKERDEGIGAPAAARLLFD